MSPVGGNKPLVIVKRNSGGEASQLPDLVGFIIICVFVVVVVLGESIFWVAKLAVVAFFSDRV